MSKHEAISLLEASKQALEDIEFGNFVYAKETLRQAIAEAEKQEPVMVIGENESLMCRTLPTGTKLYTHPYVATPRQPKAEQEPVAVIPLKIEDGYVRDYLWDRALIAIDDPCCKSHPHENMNEYCKHKTELVRKIAQEPDPYDEVQIAHGLPKAEQEPVGYGWKDPYGAWYYSAVKELDYVVPLYTHPQPKAEQEPKRRPSDYDPLTDEQCDAIYSSLNEWARELDAYDFGLPQVCGGGMEGARQIIRAAHGIRPTDFKGEA